MAVGLAEGLLFGTAVATGLVKGSDLAAWQKGAAGALVKWLDRAAGGALAKRQRVQRIRKAAKAAEAWVALQPDSPARRVLAQAGPQRWPEVGQAIAELGTDLDGARLRAAVAEALALGASDAPATVREQAAELYVQALLMVLLRSGERAAVAADLRDEARAARQAEALEDVLARLDPTTMPFSVGTLLAACHAQVGATLASLEGRYRADLYVPRAIEGAVAEVLDAPAGRGSGGVVVAPPGTGKTNLLCHLAHARVSRQPVVLLRADGLDDGPEALHRGIAWAWRRAHDGVLLRDTADAVRALAIAAERLGRPALVLVDGVDAHPDPAGLARALRALLDDARGRPVRVLLAARPDTWRTLQDHDLRGRLLTLPRSGDPALGAFTDQELGQALDRYLDHYEVDGNLAVSAAERCRHPALLRLLCEVYRGREVGPSLSLRLGALFDLYWARTLDEAARRPLAPDDPGTPAARGARMESVLLALAGWLLDHEARGLPVDGLAGAVPDAGDPAAADSPAGRLVGAGVLDVRVHPGGRTEVRFVFEELARHAIGRALVARWTRAGLDEAGIHAEIESHIATTGDAPRVAAALVHAGTRLWEGARIRVWPALLEHPRLWRRAGFAVLAQVDARALGEELDDVMVSHLVDDPARAVPALDCLKTPEIARAVRAEVRARAGRLLANPELAVRRRAALVLRFSPAAEAVPLLAAALRDRRVEVRRNATTALLEQGPLGVNVLLAELVDEDPRDRAAAALALGALSAHPGRMRLWPGLDDAVGPLLTALRDPEARVRERAVQALDAWIQGHGMDELPVPPGRLQAALESALADPAAGVRRRAAEALASAGDPAVGAALADALADPVTQVASAAAAALGTLRPGDAAEHLTRAAGEARAPRTRAAALRALHRVDEPAALAAATQACLDGDRRVRAAAAEVARDVISSGTLPAAPAPLHPRLVTLLDGPGPTAAAAATALALWEGAARAAGAALPERPTAVLPVLSRVLGGRSVDGRVQAARALGQTGDADALVPLLSALAVRSAPVRAAALEALAALGDPRAVPAIRAGVAAGRLPPAHARAVATALERRAETRAPTPDIADLCLLADDPDPARQVAALEALGRSGAPEAIAAVEAALGDRTMQVRMAAIEARRAQGGEGLVRALLPRLADQRAGVRRQAAEALGALPTRPADAKATRGLRRALGDANARVRAAAARALARLAASEADADLRRLLGDADPEVQEAARSARRALSALGSVDPEATTRPRTRPAP
jgi:HEAT repeat protein